ncbi:putative TetR-family transcriptional regulator [Streptomyces sp. EAS-AB2608]|uniref:TetR/AcrR family transcriptional regulator n=1 Tax=Streptomyces bangladeshensis TaxID=295352 RepID=A0ABN3BEY8_9ACTN|nr:putative TetR-family transcriptional regulator [Streptomyces sp. EAS-AB2608]CUW26568.1 putative HTH-type transcriptional regulator YxaF [Streptomyces reticuli]
MPPGIRERAKHAEAPLGSTYHSFPEGKQRLAGEAVRHTGERVARNLREELAAGPAAGLRAFPDLRRKTVVDSDVHAGCPVLAVAIEEPPAGEVPPAPAAVADVFEQREALLAAPRREQQAAQLATLIVAAVAGTVAMCRARRSTGPPDRIAEQLHTLITTAIED